MSDNLRERHMPEKERNYLGSDKYTVEEEKTVTIAGRDVLVLRGTYSSRTFRTLWLVPREKVFVVLYRDGERLAGKKSRYEQAYREMTEECYKEARSKLDPLPDPESE